MHKKRRSDWGFRITKMHVSQNIWEITQKNASAKKAPSTPARRSKASLRPCSQILCQIFHCKSTLRMKIPRMRKIVKEVIFSRDNVSFHTRHKKWEWSITLAGTHQKRVITSCGHTACGPVEDFIPGRICGICDALSALSWFIIWRQRCLSWFFVVGTLRRGSRCHHKVRCPCFLGYIFWCQNVSGGCDCCDDGQVNFKNIFKMHLTYYSLFIFRKLYLFNLFAYVDYAVRRKTKQNKATRKDYPLHMTHSFWFASSFTNIHNAA